MGLNTYTDIRNLPPADSRVVIINCGTKWVTSLAVLSAHRHAKLPIVLIDCESKDGSKEHFNRIAKESNIDVDWVAWPLRPHPVALDQLFKQIPAENVLLMDSDLEICSPNLIEQMSETLHRNSNAYASGFLHGPAWLGKEHGLPAYTGYYAERMWIPLVYMKTGPIRAALKQGFSFLNRRPYYELPSAPRLSRVLGLRHRIVGLKHVPFPKVGRDRPMYDGRFPKFVEFDTGADLHAQLLRNGFAFEALPINLWGDVVHHHGVTRAHLAKGVRRIAKQLRLISRATETDQATVLDDVLRRLAVGYGVGAPK